MELVDVAPAENPVNPHNPLGKIPTLVLDDGAALYDSRVIVEFLDHASPLNRLIPAEIRERVQVRRWEALADGVVDAGILVRGGFQLKPGDIDWPAEYPVLGRHYAKLMERPAFADTAPK
jgi:glutathione S-transferase